MSLLMEPPVEVAWAEDAGPMTVAVLEDWPPSPVREPSFEVVWELSALAADPVGDWRVDWAVPGVPRFGDAEPTGYLPPPSREVQAYAAAVAGLSVVDPTRADPAQALADLAELLRVDEDLRVVRLERLTDAHTRQLAGLQDKVSVQTWARKRFDDVPRDDIALAGQLSGTPVLQAAVQGRRVSVEAARLAGRAVKKLTPYVDRADGSSTANPPAR